jgi:phosphoribosylformylglycinamidine synthase
VSTQYDSQLFLNTVAGPGANAAVLRLKHPTSGADTGRALALTTDGNHRWCAFDALVGSAMVICESVLNLACVGAWPLAMVNCLNFGNPEHPEVMRQLSDSIDGLSEACDAFGVPVVGGNVSLYNESRGSDIDPTPVVGLVGLVDRLERRPPPPALVAGDEVVVLGGPAGDLGLPDAVDYPAVSAVASLVRDAVVAGELSGVQDVADGGLAVALGEMAARGEVGLDAEAPVDVTALWSEWPGRVVVVGTDLAPLRARAAAAGVPSSALGTAGGDRLRLHGPDGVMIDLAVDDVVAAHRDRLPSTMAAAVEH